MCDFSIECNLETGVVVVTTNVRSVRDRIWRWGFPCHVKPNGDSTFTLPMAAIGFKRGGWHKFLMASDASEPLETARVGPPVPGPAEPDDLGWDPDDRLPIVSSNDGPNAQEEP